MEILANKWLQINRAQPVFYSTHKTSKACDWSKSTWVPAQKATADKYYHNTLDDEDFLVTRSSATTTVESDSSLQTSLLRSSQSHLQD